MFKVGVGDGFEWEGADIVRSYGSDPSCNWVVVVWRVEFEAVIEMFVEAPDGGF